MPRHQASRSPGQRAVQLVPRQRDDLRLSRRVLAKGDQRRLVRQHEVLSDLIEAYEAWNDHEPEPTILIGERVMTTTAATGML